MPNKHKYRLMRPHSRLAEQLPGEYPESVNTALARYLHLISSPPQFSEAEFNLICDGCLGWATQLESPETLRRGLALQVEDAIALEQLDKKWSVDASALVPRLYGLSEVEAIAVIHAIERFWKTESA